jgi:transcriptional regulator with XRE-family HTH domain
MKLKRWADKQDLNQHEAAARLGISESFLSEYLHGKKSFGADNALRISKITGISIMDLLFPKIVKEG